MGGCVCMCLSEDDRGGFEALTDKLVNEYDLI